ncbi:hypothetical protein BRADI_1g77179v3 [Brachypodium distachyon]|uniref:Uncharacterized protein n=1 Tax=Brachypodium distachyon TaxID=15368 RepID=A0A2K2DVI8_BRADI|nr:hypothetical protein BRADI_1g77179v3 [Brachypodium distachyon]
MPHLTAVNVTHTLTGTYILARPECQLLPCGFLMIQQIDFFQGILIPENDRARSYARRYIYSGSAKQD